MESIGLPVPALLARSEADGLVLVEDLGDVTLQRQIDGPPTPLAEMTLPMSCGVIQARSLFEGHWDPTVLQ